MDRIPELLEAECFYVLSGFTAIVTYILSGPRMRLLQSMLEISSMLPPKSYKKLSRFIYAKDIIGLFYLAAHAPTYFFIMQMNILIVVYNIYITMMVFQMDMLYINCVCILKACFQRINDNLIHMQEFVTKNEKPVLGLMYHENKNSFVLIKLNALKKQHLMISNTVQMLNMTFSLQLLATIVMTFTEITYNIYLYVQWWQQRRTLSSAEITYVNLLAFLMDMQYVNCVCVIKTCFKEINDNLENLRELLTYNIPRWIYHEQRCPFLLMRLKTLQKQHLMISETVQRLNVIFSLHLLATIVLVFKQITFFVYYNIVNWQDGTIFFKLNMIYHMHVISFLIYYFLRIILIVWACETGKNQAIKIGTTIHDVLNITKDEQIKDELKLFCLQIMHCKNTFSTKGVTVGATLLTEIVSGITTYILILIQFLITSHSCDSKRNA
ncbi:PREDICTED: uncharacterized protein LOC105460874 [Wasmannia auropunctata]|uniref:uncharacterized protein LOC105460874 n=1 Tax=Wasmannia auropunctata TaxID=64793 RepID=UPI0005F013C2|nr:PREDICTED: uncharacterized protein LOC105460874 [Wasmannia auropunctata]